MLVMSNMPSSILHRRCDRVGMEFARRDHNGVRCRSNGPQNGLVSFALFSSPTCVYALIFRPPQIIPAAHRNFNLNLNWFQRLNRGKHIIFHNYYLARHELNTPFSARTTKRYLKNHHSHRTSLPSTPPTNTINPLPSMFLRNAPNNRAPSQDRTTVTLDLVNSEVFPEPLPIHITSVISENKRMESSVLLYHHLHPDRLASNPDDCTQERIQFLFAQHRCED
jgi:hypothetical protein